MRSWVEAVSLLLHWQLQCRSAAKHQLHLLAPFEVYVQQQPSRMAEKLRYPWASQVWPEEPSEGRCEARE